MNSRRLQRGNFLYKVAVTLSVIGLAALGIWWFNRPPDPFSDAAMAVELGQSAERLGVSEADLKLSREFSDRYVLNANAMSAGDWAEIKKRLSGKSVVCRLFLPPAIMALNGPYRDEAISEFRRLALGADKDSAEAAKLIIKQKGIGYARN